MITTAYAEQDDITFILDDSEEKVEVVGFYFGKPDEEETQKYKGKLVAELEKDVNFVTLMTN